MGRLILLILIIAAIVLVWKAFGPGTWNKNRQQLEAQRRQQQVKGPDDDENFLWELEKNRFKKRRAQEEAARQEQERITRAQRKYGQPNPEATKPQENKEIKDSSQNPPKNPDADPDQNPQ